MYPFGLDYNENMNDKTNEFKPKNRIPEDRYLRVSGTPYQVGLVLGEALQSQLAQGH